MVTANSKRIILVGILVVCIYLIYPTRKESIILGYNPVDDAWYPLDDIFSKLKLKPTKFYKDYIVEETGLLVPYQYDCEQWDGFPYNTAVPSRWVRCERHKAILASALSSFIPELPIIDEEMAEMVAVYSAVLNAKETFTLVEMGARWGTWGARAAMYARQVCPNVKVNLLFYEPNQIAANGLENVMNINNLTGYTLVRSVATAEHFNRWIDTVDNVNVVDIDIQGGELELLPKIMANLKKKASRVIVGTHSLDIHAKVKLYFDPQEWSLQYNVPFSSDTKCVSNSVRLSRGNWPGKWNVNCTFQTSVGKIIQWDGELIYNNLQ